VEFVLLYTTEVCGSFGPRHYCFSYRLHLPFFCFPVHIRICKNLLPAEEMFQLGCNLNTFCKTNKISIQLVLFFSLKGQTPKQTASCC